MHLSSTVWLIIGVVALIGVSVALDVFFDIDYESPLWRSIFAIGWLYMACWAFRDVIVDRPLNVGALFGFAFCAGGVIYNIWPRRGTDETSREIEEEVRKQIREQIEEIRNAAQGRE
jgi:hypothetical protein